MSLGRAGSGKSFTFTVKAECDWSGGTLWEDIALPWTICCQDETRDNGIWRANKISELFHLRELGLSAAQEVEVEACISDYPEHFALVCDGLDEGKVKEQFFCGVSWAEWVYEGCVWLSRPGLAGQWMTLQKVEPSIDTFSCLALARECARVCHQVPRRKTRLRDDLLPGKEAVGVVVDAHTVFCSAGLWAVPGGWADSTDEKQHIEQSNTPTSSALRKTTSPGARSEKRPGSEVSFRVLGNICFFALIGRKYDAEVEFTCCHSQKSAKVGFSKGFLSDLIGPDRVVDTSRGQPARCRWEDETMAISCKTMHLVVVWWPKLKRVLPEVSPVPAWHRNMCVVFFRKSWEKSPRFAPHGDTVSTTPWRKLPRTDVAKDCFCHCRDASEKLVDFTKASWQTPKLLKFDRTICTTFVILRTAG